MATNVLSFLKDKNVFLTGGTGFLGKVTIEKLLRSTEVKCIYLLVRQKRGRSANQRVDDLLNDPLFATLRKTKPDVNLAQRVAAIYGDCALPNLGLSGADVQTLVEQVDIVLHSAATVRFDEPLSVAVAINVRATLDLIKLAKQMKKLKAFVHVSSAFANCTVLHVEERYYVDQIGIGAEKICGMLDLLGPEQLDRLCDALCRDFPNTYCFSKALAEDAILTQGAGLPVCVFRPGIVISTCREPVSGWIDNLYGPTSIMFGVARGILRVMYVQMNYNASVVPADFCANEILACAWHTSRGREREASAPPRIYNLVPDADNLLKWGEYRRVVETHGKKIPLSRLLWYPFLIDTTSPLLYTLLTFCFHTLPGYALDFGLLLLRKKRRMVRIYRSIHKQNDLLKYFVAHQWTFDTQNTRALWRLLSPEDQRLFPFDMSAIDWSQYFYESLLGMRLYMAKEDPGTIPRGVKLLRRFLILHRTLQTAFYGGSLLLIFWMTKRILGFL